MYGNILEYNEIIIVEKLMSFLRYKLDIFFIKSKLTF